LDTCALIWSADADERAGKLQLLLSESWAKGGEVAVSPISAWEIGNLAASRRFAFAMAPLTWFESAVDRAGLRVLDLSARVLAAATELPDLPHQDPADRIIIATAREMGYQVVTRDRKILDYADKGHVMAMAC
jgi:PIN domain nuclease of toxin-antitoxin system